TIVKNNLEGVEEVVRQLRLRDIGGIIVIDFIDMANPKNRETVEDALRGELERDRTKTYVVEISPLGLVEMTRQNVTDGPREILTSKCPVCEGDGIVVSDASVAIDVERKLRALASASRHTAVKAAVNDHRAGVGTRDGYTVSVGDAAGMVGKTVRVRVERFVDGTAYATLVSKAKPEAEPITAEGQAEKPTRKPPAKRTAETPASAEQQAEAETVEAPAEEPVAEEEVPTTD